ncbi:MAG TPA: T9SS type B sorting domain-containing protein [Lutibacter sp.]
MKKHFIVFVFCLFVGLFNSYCQQDCTNALSVCSDANSDGLVFGYGQDDFKGFDVSGCLGSGGTSATTVEVNSYWFRVKLAESGKFGFTITPSDLSEDWDFAVYGPNDTCGALRDPVACNYRGTGGYTGVGVDPSGVKTIGYEDWLDVTTGQVYFVLINQYDGSNAGFSISWTGAVMDDFPDALDCKILVDLGPPRELCGGGATNLNVNTFIPSATYNWFKRNPSTGVFNPLPTPIGSPYQLYVNTEGRYRVEVFSATGTLLGDDEIDITFLTKPVANLVPDIIACDSDGNGLESFNLNSKTSAIKSGQTGMAVTYYKAKEFAKNAISSISSPYTSSGETIWARIENSAKPECYDLTSFDLKLSLPLIANKPPDLKQCDNDNDGEMIFNLESQTSIILGSQTGVVTYYRNEEDAKEPKGPISNTTNYLSKTTTIWVRVEPTIRSVCAAFTSFNIEVFEKAIANSTTNIVQCDFDNDGLYQFDFKTLKDADIIGTQSASTFEVNYFATQANANNNLNALPNPYTNITPYAEERIYARIQNKGFADCFETTSFTLQVFDMAYPAIPSNIPVLSYCDDASDGDDTNGFYQFDLTEREVVILNGQSPYVFDVIYYEDSAFTKQIPNQTTYPNIVANQQTIYVRVKNKTLGNVKCFADTSFLIEVKPLPNALTTPYDLIQCDEDGNPDGIVNFNLTEADFFVTIGDNNLNVTYHLSAIDAASGINKINKSSFSNNVSSTVFARVSSVDGCYRIVQVNLKVSVTAFPASYPGHKIVVCDDDDTIDGLHEFNLGQATSEIISLFSSPNLRVGYYRNQMDAVSETNIISPANAYLSEVPFSQIIWVRVESAINGGCFGIAPVILLTVNPRPEFDLDETDVVCLNDLPKTVSTYNPNSTYSYEWTDIAGDIISNQPFVDVVKAGVYTVVATSILGCESFPKQIAVTESIIADISSEDIQIIDNSGNNSITINNANQNLGIGDYEFALDDIFGPYQDSPVFSEVIPGKHIIYVSDKNNCGIAQVTVYVFGFPNFFTPNDDGQNDTWNILGVDPTVFKSSIIYIFDRYGKLLANFSAYQQGWDGFYNSKKAISTDYWYLAKMTDYNGVTSEYKGHFSLIRR